MQKIWNLFFKANHQFLRINCRDESDLHYDDWLDLRYWSILIIWKHNVILKRMRLNTSTLSNINFDSNNDTTKSHSSVTMTSHTTVVKSMDIRNWRWLLDDKNTSIHLQCKVVLKVYKRIHSISEMCFSTVFCRIISVKRTSQRLHRGLQLRIRLLSIFVTWSRLHCHHFQNKTTTKSVSRTRSIREILLKRCVLHDIPLYEIKKFTHTNSFNAHTMLFQSWSNSESTRSTTTETHRDTIRCHPRFQETSVWSLHQKSLSEETYFSDVNFV